MRFAKRLSESVVYNGISVILCRNSEGIESFSKINVCFGILFRYTLDIRAYRVVCGNLEAFLDTPSSVSVATEKNATSPLVI